MKHWKLISYNNLKYLISFFLCGIASGLLLPPFFLIPLGFIIFPIIFFLITKSNFKKNNKIKHFLFGIIYGLGFGLITLIWINQPFLLDDNTKKISFLAYLLVFYISIYYGFAFLIISFFKKNFSKLILIPTTFVICEILREEILYGFPWVTFALTYSFNIYTLNLVYYFGTYGLSFLTIFIFLIPVSFFYLSSKNNHNYLFKYNLYLFFGCFLPLLILLIFYRFNTDTFNENRKNISFSINQLNISYEDKNNTELYNSRLNKISKIIKEGNKNSIFVFSENDFPFLITQNNIATYFQKILEENQSIIIGGIRKQNDKFFNSLYNISKNNSNYFDKKILVPFGEFLPFRNYLEKLNNIVGNVDFSPGINERKLKLNKSFMFLPVICYEIIFFNDLLNKNNQNIPIIVNLTNDFWFGSFSGPYQHFYLSRIRSAELNKYIIRVSNNGVSVIFDNKGKILESIELNKNGQKNISLNMPKDLNNLHNYHFIIYIFLIIMIGLAILIDLKKNE